jgi:transcriptional regulator with XRE-family HTH domain
MSPESLSQIAGARSRELRTASGRTAETVASAARKYGFDWTSMTVAHIETGKRQLRLEEFALFPSILSAGLDGPVGFADLIPDDAEVRLSSSDKRTGFISGRQVRAALNGSNVSEVRRVTRGPDPRIAGLLPMATSTSEVAQASQDARGEAEQAAARKLGFDPVQICHAARARWGRTLSEEREARVGVADSEVTPRQLQARRGHVTRQLLAELAVHLSNYPRSTDGEH